MRKRLLCINNTSGAEVRKVRNTHKLNSSIAKRPVSVAPVDAYVTFGELPIGKLFTLRPSHYINIAFVKTTALGGEVHSLDALHPAYQTFPQEYPVWILKQN